MKTQFLTVGDVIKILSQFDKNLPIGENLDDGTWLWMKANFKLVPMNEISRFSVNENDPIYKLDNALILE